MKKVLVGLMLLSGTFFAQETAAANAAKKPAKEAPPAPTNQTQVTASLTNVSSQYSVTNNLKPIGQSFNLYYLGGNQQIMGFKYGLHVHNKKGPASALLSIGAGSAFKTDPLLHLLFEVGFMYKISNRYSFGATLDFSTMLKTNYKLGISFKSRFDYVLLSLGGGYDLDKTAFVSLALGFVY